MHTSSLLVCSGQAADPTWLVEKGMELEEGTIQTTYEQGLPGWSRRAWSWMKAPSKQNLNRAHLAGREGHGAG